MQIVIDMCKDDFDEICMQARMVEDTGSLFGRIRKSIFHGTPLPKGHGPLIDAYELYPTCRYYKDCDHEVRCDRCKFEGDYVVSEKDLAAVSIIIEADKDQRELSVEESIKQRIARDVKQDVKAHTASGFIQGIRSPFECGESEE